MLTVCLLTVLGHWRQTQRHCGHGFILELVIELGIDRQCDQRVNQELEQASSVAIYT